MARPPTRPEGRQPDRPARFSLRSGRRGLPLRGLVRLVILCLVVGLSLSLFGIGPEDFWHFIWSAASGLYNWLVAVAGNLAAYVVIGACVVIPIVLIRRLWRRTIR